MSSVLETVAQGHEHAAMLRVLLGDAKAQRVAVEPFRGLLVRHPQQDMADACQLDHVNAPISHSAWGR